VFRLRLRLFGFIGLGEAFAIRFQDAGQDQQRLGKLFD
jgi:hypothetical protein